MMMVKMTKEGINTPPPPPDNRWWWWPLMLLSFGCDIIEDEERKGKKGQGEEIKKMINNKGGPCDRIKAFLACRFVPHTFPHISNSKD
jgi:hypothetical protein